MGLETIRYLILYISSRPPEVTNIKFQAIWSFTSILEWVWHITGTLINSECLGDKNHLECKILEQSCKIHTIKYFKIKDHFTT